MSGQELGWAALDVAWLYGVVLVLGLGVLALFRWKAVVRRRLGDMPAVKRMTESTVVPVQVLRWVLVLIAAALIVTALMRPQYGTREADLKNRGIDVVIALDMSKSMMVADVPPENRLEASTVLLGKVLDDLSGGRVALVPFAGSAYTQTPLTTDFDTVRAYLQTLRVEDMPIGGTRIGNAIEHAVGLFLSAEKEAEKDEEDPDLKDLEQPAASHFKAVILVTDGEDHDDDALEAAKKAAGKNVRIYTVGIGTQQTGKQIPVLAHDGTRVGWVNDDKGMPIFSELNTALLSSIADATQGAPFVYGQGDVSKGLAAAIDGLEKEEYKHHYENLREDRFQFVLIPALLLLVLETLLSDKARRRKRRRAQ